MLTFHSVLQISLLIAPNLSSNWKSDELHDSLGTQSQEEFRALVSRGVAVSWDGRKIIAPAGVIDGNGFMDLTVGVSKKLS